VDVAEGPDRREVHAVPHSGHCTTPAS
jgi:hypothetical protein